MCESSSSVAIGTPGVFFSRRHVAVDSFPSRNLVLGRGREDRRSPVDSWYFACRAAVAAVICKT
jgi:hypothetical protein